MRASESLFSFLSGPWHFSRSVRHAAGDVFTVTGTCSWAPLSAVAPFSDLQYEERGRMLRGEAFVADVRQAATWHLRGQLRAEVFFPDGRPFHDVELATLAVGAACRCAHDCPPDVYAGELALAAPLPGEGGPLALELAWRVTGPQKDYTSRTRWWRDAGEPTGKQRVEC